MTTLHSHDDRDDDDGRGDRLRSLLAGPVGGADSDVAVPGADGLDAVVRRARSRRSATFGVVVSVIALLIVIPAMAVVRTGDDSQIDLATNPPRIGTTPGTVAADGVAGCEKRSAQTAIDEERERALRELRQQQAQQQQNFADALNNEDVDPANKEFYRGQRNRAVAKFNELQADVDRLEAGGRLSGTPSDLCCRRDRVMSTNEQIASMKQEQAQQQKNYKDALTKADEDPANRDFYRAQKDRAIARFNDLQIEVERIRKPGVVVDDHPLDFRCLDADLVPGTTGTGPTSIPPDTAQSGATAAFVPTTGTIWKRPVPESPTTLGPTLPPTVAPTTIDVTPISPTVPTTTGDVVNCGRNSPNGWPTTIPQMDLRPCMLDAFARGQRATSTVRIYEPPNGIPEGTDPDYPMDWSFEITGIGQVRVVEDGRRSGQRPQELRTLVCQSDGDERFARAELHRLHARLNSPPIAQLAPSRSSKQHRARSTSRSASGRPITWRPTGKPPGVWPATTVPAGRRVRLHG